MKKMKKMWNKTNVERKKEGKKERNKGGQEIIISREKKVLIKKIMKSENSKRTYGSKRSMMLRIDKQKKSHG